MLAVNLYLGLISPRQGLPIKVVVYTLLVMETAAVTGLEYDRLMKVKAMFISITINRSVLTQTGQQMNLDSRLGICVVRFGHSAESMDGITIDVNFWGLRFVKEQVWSRFDISLVPYRWKHKFKWFLFVGHLFLVSSIDMWSFLYKRRCVWQKQMVFFVTFGIYTFFSGMKMI